MTFRWEHAEYFNASWIYVHDSCASKTWPFSLESRHHLCLPEKMSSRTAWLFSVLGVRMKHLCAVTLNPFVSGVESFNCRAGPCRGLCERTWRHTKLWWLQGSLLFIAYPALRCLMAVLGSLTSSASPQIMIRKDANGKEYNDYQLQHRSVYWTGWRGFIGCDAEMHLVFLMVLKKLTARWIHFSHHLGPVQVFLQHRQEVMNLSPAFAGLCHEWLEEHLTTMKTTKKTFVILVPLTSVNISTMKCTD